MAINYQLLGKRIKEIRQRLGLSQEELADRASCSPQYISIIESGHKTVSLKILVNIADSLDVTVGMLLMGNQKESSREYITEVELLFEGCTRYEKQVLYEQLHSLMLILKNNRELI